MHRVSKSISISHEATALFTYCERRTRLNWILESYLKLAHVPSGFARRKL
jgi:hypothetical protein